MSSRHAKTLSSVRDPWRLVTIALSALLMLVLASGAARAQDTHVVVIVGVGGDEAHVTQFDKWALTLLDAAQKHGVPPANISYFGERSSAPARMKDRATRDNITKAFTELAAKAKADDDILAVLIGHGSFDGKAGAFNLPGPDLSAADYALLLGRFTTQKIAFVNTASSSGAFLEPLAGPARTIMTATKTGGERNETRFAQFFVEALDSEAADRDRNGRVSMLEAFDYTATKVKASYEQGGHILTEHATLDDGSEGKLAGAMYLAPERSRTAAAQAADPALRALLTERDALERQVNDLRLKKDQLPADQYETRLEELLTALALKTRAIREFEGKP